MTMNILGFLYTYTQVGWALSIKYPKHVIGHNLWDLKHAKIDW